MKKTKHHQPAHQDKQSSQGRKATPAPGKPGPPPLLPRWLVVLVGLAGSGAASYFVLTTYVLPKLPDALVGTWQVRGGEMNGTQMTFQRDGTFTALVNLDGREVPVQARVEFHDKTLRFIVVNGLTGKEETKTQTIKSLTEKEMIVEENGATSKLVRVK